MATGRQNTAGPQIAGGSSQQTNPPLDPQVTLELLQAFVKQDIQSRLDQMKPEIEQKIDDLVSEAKEKVVREIADSKIELQQVKNSVLGAVAVFAAFFTFVSVNVNIFSKANAMEGLAIMIVMWICLMGFTYTFFLFLWDKWRESKYWTPVVVGMIITCGILWWVKPAPTHIPTPSSVTDQSGKGHDPS